MRGRGRRRTARRRRRRAPTRRARGRRSIASANGSKAPEWTLPAWSTTTSGRPSSCSSAAAGRRGRGVPGRRPRPARGAPGRGSAAPGRRCRAAPRPPATRTPGEPTSPRLATSQPARRSTSSRPAARQVKLAIVPPVTKPTALSAGRPSRSSSHASVISSTAVWAGVEVAQAGVLVPGADEPVGGQRGRVGAADHEAEEAARRRRGQPGLARPRQVVDDVRRGRRSVREVDAQSLRPPAPRRRGRGHAALVEGGEPGQRDGRGPGPAAGVAVLGRRPVICASCRGFPSVAPARPTLSCVQVVVRSRCWTGRVAGPRRRPRRPGRRAPAAAPVAPGRRGEAPGPRLPVHLLLPAPGPAAALAPRVRRAARRRAGVRRAQGVRRRRRHRRVRRVAGAAAARARQPAARHRVAAGAHRAASGCTSGRWSTASPPTRCGTTTGRCGSGRRAPTPSSSRTGSSARTSTPSASSPGRRDRSTRCSPGATTGRRTSSRGACTPGWTSTSTPSG